MGLVDRVTPVEEHRNGARGIHPERADRDMPYQGHIPERRYHSQGEIPYVKVAYDPETELFYLTGKLWPRLFVVRFDDGDPL